MTYKSPKLQKVNAKERDAKRIETPHRLKRLLKLHSQRAVLIPFDFIAVGERKSDAEVFAIKVWMDG